MLTRDLEQEEIQLLCPNLPEGRYCYGPLSHVFILRGQVNVEIKSASVAKWV